MASNEPVPKYAEALEEEAAPEVVVDTTPASGEMRAATEYPPSKKESKTDALARREADEALKLAMSATSAANKALHRALNANRGKDPPGEVGNGEMTVPLARVNTALAIKERELREESEITFSGKLCGGLMADIKKRARVYVSDWTDGFQSKTISATVLLYFACLAPAIAFGALLEKFTHGDMGAIEVIASTFICGTLFALFAGQPLLILGGTGPVAIFESIMHKAAEGYLGVPFLVARLWTGVWISIILGLCAVTDMCYLIKYITRFTDEIFAALISSIFIYEACKALLYPFKKDYDTCVEGQPCLDTLKDAIHDASTLMSLLLGLGTFVMLMALRSFRKSKYLMASLRTLLADFAPIVAIGLMTYIDLLAEDMATPKLRIPAGIKPSKDCREWQVPWRSYGPEYSLAADTKVSAGLITSPLGAIDAASCLFTPAGSNEAMPLSSAPTMGIPAYLPFAMILPAMLASVLLYLDQNITARLINKSDNRLKKEGGYHLDMFCLAALIMICSMLGLPWMCAATVRSINHLMALCTKEEVVDAHGHKTERIASVAETRLTGLLIHLLIGCSLFLVSVLKHVPMAVLFGLFLTMGITSLTTIQLWERISLLFMEPKLYPPTSYVRQVSRVKLHTFTFVQILGFLVLYVVKKSAFAMCFPLVILCFVPIRNVVLPMFFSERELHYLDSEDVVEEEDEGDLAPK